jgi:hypothetical protein
MHTFVASIPPSNLNQTYTYLHLHLPLQYIQLHLHGTQTRINQSYANATPIQIAYPTGRTGHEYRTFKSSPEPPNPGTAALARPGLAVDPCCCKCLVKCSRIGWDTIVVWMNRGWQGLGFALFGLFGGVSYYIGMSGVVLSDFFVVCTP